MMQERQETAEIIKSEDVIKQQKNLNPINLFDCPICSICLSQIATTSFVLKCGHFYHSECINEHLKMKLECPTCRT